MRTEGTAIETHLVRQQRSAELDPLIKDDWSRNQLLTSPDKFDDMIRTVCVVAQIDKKVIGLNSVTIRPML